MVRAFTISFDFDGRTYLALATLKKAEEEMVYSIRFYDESLSRIVPDRTFSYSSKKPLCPASLHHPQALRLFTCIDHAILSHLEAAKIA